MFKTKKGKEYFVFLAKSKRKRKQEKFSEER